MTRTTTAPAPAPSNSIVIEGAREHNLRNLSLTIPRGKFVVLTGVSGSGKSTLAFDCLFAEGQRRFLDSMNAYARQFVEQLSRPDVDRITGIPPTVSIEQRNSRGGGKSTVATVTEIYHFLRLLFSRAGTLHCPDCQVPVRFQSRAEVIRQLSRESHTRGSLRLLAPIVRNRKGHYRDLFEWAARQGFTTLRVDGKLCAATPPRSLARYQEHNLEVQVGLIEPTAGKSSDPSQPTIETLTSKALDLGKGACYSLDAAGVLKVHSTERACPSCSRAFDVLDPKHFSYNSPQGWCPRCRGFGELFYLPDADRGARADAIEDSWFEWQEGKREFCPECRGMRLNSVARAVRLEAAIPTSKQSQRAPPLAPTIDDLARMTSSRALDFFDAIHFEGAAEAIARDILPEIRERLRFLQTVGLGYLELGRAVPTLSGGESQRIRLAAQLGSTLSGVLYVLDEPTIGLHARDNEFLLAALRKLKARGNSILVVEHDEATMREADHIIDLGPGAGVRGGQVVACGTLRQLLRNPASVTGSSLAATKRFPSRGERRPVPISNVPRVSRRKSAAHSVEKLVLHNASLHNLKNLTIELPLRRFIAITGVSGSGKSTLIRGCLLPALKSELSRSKSVKGRQHPGSICKVDGSSLLSAAYEVDQSPIGRTPRSTPATYVGFWDAIRALYAGTPEARLRGYGPGRFSFNSPQGRCAECAGAGTIKLEMNFLPSAFVPCGTCGGSRFNPETLDIQWHGLNVAQVLELSVEEALRHFSAIPKVTRALQALHDTGLDYLKLGQISPTLSGGEAQRMKLVTHLLSGLAGAKEIPRQIQSSKPAKSNIFILEEPTIGLHSADVRRLLEVLHRLVDTGHTVIVIEHHLELIADADWVIDLGPEAGEGGGSVCAAGTPEFVASRANSHTGHFLRKLLPNAAPAKVNA